MQSSLSGIKVLDFSHAIRKYTDKHLVIRVGETIFGNAMGHFQAQIDSIQNHETKMHDFAKIATDHLVLRYQKEGFENQEIVSAELMFSYARPGAKLRGEKKPIRGEEGEVIHFHDRQRRSHGRKVGTYLGTYTISISFFLNYKLFYYDKCR